MDNPLTALAATAAQWRVRDIPPEVEWDARRAILDWFAATVPGCLAGPAVPLGRALASARGTGRAFSYVDGAQGTARHAALMNGTASHTAEFDDIFRDGGYHPGSPTISAALAVAQDEGASFEEFLRAVIGGYEVGCRIAMALQPSHYRNWHITATVGTFAAAAATAMLMRGDDDQIAHAIAIATSFAGGHQENLQGKGLTKALHCGHAADAGVLAGLAAAAGVTGSLDSLHAPHGYAAATSASRGNWAAALDGVGAWTPISRTTFKNHGCCGHIFPALDGIRAIRAVSPFEKEDIRSIEIGAYRATVSICDRMLVEEARDARFSVQYCVAALLHLGNVRMAAFAPDTLARDDIRALMAKVIVQEDEELSADYPHKRMARLKITLKDGRVLEHFQQTRKGDPDDPLSDTELTEKFDELTASALDADVRENLKAQIITGNVLPAAVPLSLRARTGAR